MKTSRLLAVFFWLAICLGHAKPLHILVTGDMHGWLQPISVQGETVGGAAEMLARWKTVEHYKPKDFLILSAGDVATGPAVSTVYKGVPALEVMNAMGYDASALGNHEFDFGMEQLRAFCKMARFPFLAANVLEGEAAVVPGFCVIEKGGIKVGLIGLCTNELHLISNQSIHIAPYVEAIRKEAPLARAQGAQVLLVLAHVPLDELKAAAADVVDLGIPLMMGGHSHELGQEQEPKSGTWIVNSGKFWQAYSRIDLDYDPVTKKTTVLKSVQPSLKQKEAAADSKVRAVVAKWQSKLDADPAYGKILGHLSSRLELFWPVANFVCDAWLAMDPQADVALNNNGAMRQNLEPGPLTRGVLTGLLPFNDSLYRLRLSGKQLLAYLPQGEDLMGMAGITRKGKTYTVVKTGRAIRSGGSYQVLMNNYMYGTNETLKAADPHPVTVEKDWRDPIERWLLLHPSSPEKPLETILDLRPRL